MTDNDVDEELQNEIFEGKRKSSLNYLKIKVGFFPDKFFSFEMSGGLSPSQCQTMMYIFEGLLEPRI